MGRGNWRVAGGALGRPTNPHCSPRYPFEGSGGSRMMPGFHTISTVRVFALACLFSVVSSGLASALPYTLGSSLVITGSEAGNPGVIGSLDPVALGSSLADPFAVETGQTSFASHDVFVVQLTLASGSLNVDLVQVAVSSTPFFGNPAGAGAFADISGQAPSTATLPAFGFRADFGFPGGALEAGESSTRLFVTYAPSGSALATGRAATFTISAGTNFSVQGTIVPEPGTAVLLAFSLSGLAIHRRRRNLAQ